MGGRLVEPQGTHADRQHGAHFEHDVAVSPHAHVGIFCAWVVKAQLFGHVLDEGFHPGGTSPDAHELRPENRAPSAGAQSTP